MVQLPWCYEVGVDFMAGVYVCSIKMLPSFVSNNSAFALFVCFQKNTASSSRCGVVARVLDWESGDLGSSPHLTMEAHWVTLGQSQTLSPAYITGLLLRG